MDENIKNLLFKKVPLKILLTIDKEKKANATKITHELEGNYSYVVRLISRFEDNDLIETKTEGRKKIIELTPKGTKIIEKINELLGIEKTLDKEKETNLSSKKFKELNKKIKEIYQEELRDKDSITKKESARIGKRLGPYKREINKMKKKEKSNELKTKIGELKKKIDTIMEEKNKKTE